MPQEKWNRVDDYYMEIMAPEAKELQWVLKNNAAAGLPRIDVSPLQGKFLGLLIVATGAKRVLELGTLGGYSAIWMARSLPDDGILVSLELESLHANIAAANFEKADVADKVDLRLGGATESLAAMVAEQVEPFDFVFVDADKPNYPNYLELVLKLSRPGTLIVFDNVVREGAIVDSDNLEPEVEGVRKLNKLLPAKKGVMTTVLQTVGPKGYDGFCLAVVCG